MARIFAITGAFGALGSEVARIAEGQGACVALIDAAGSPAETGEGGGILRLAGVDLTDAEQARAAVDAAANRFGGLDVLLNIAGGFTWETVADGAAETWSRMFRINILTALNASRAAIPYLTRSRAGRIVNVGAAAASRPNVGMGPYAAAKAGVHSLTQALAEELKPTGVTVNTVAPSIIDTPANRAAMPDDDASAWVSPREVAEVMLFLASERAGAVTAALTPVTGRL